MRERFGRVISTMAMILTAMAVLQGTAEAGEKRQAIRRELAALRAELAQLSTQINFVHRDLRTQPARMVAPGANPDSGGGWGSLCYDPCAEDSDDDGIGDCEDYCPCDPNTADTDSDGVMDCADPCPDDATDDCINPCRNDSDGDSVNDCEDPCPYDPAAAVDGDEDGLPDCVDPCPDDATNLCWDPCRLDQDGDGVDDCNDWCPWAGGTPENCLPPGLPTDPGKDDPALGEALPGLGARK